jgi:hypothetical protein
MSIELLPALSSTGPWLHWAGNTPVPATAVTWAPAAAFGRHRRATGRRTPSRVLLDVARGRERGLQRGHALLRHLPDARHRKQAWGLAQTPYGRRSRVRRLRERRIRAEDLYELRLGRESEPEAPEGAWYEDFGSFKLSGEGQFPKSSSSLATPHDAASYRHGRGELGFDGPQEAQPVSGIVGGNQAMRDHAEG